MKFSIGKFKFVLNGFTNLLSYNTETILLHWKSMIDKNIYKSLTIKNGNRNKLNTICY